ncbi:MAG: glycosyltransferase, partial [Acidobacteriaceae bacterium]|nr:glycosyltransferase [Acidobacteriaceae bacterium]
MKTRLNIVVCGLSLTSSWGNGHATTYRALLKALAGRGHRIHFLERDVPWYRENRDLVDPAYCRVSLYGSLDELQSRFRDAITYADAVIIGSYVPEGVSVGHWINDVASGPVCFYDIDTPVTLAKLADGHHDYISPELVTRYDQYFLFTGGPALDYIKQHWGSPCARALYCSVDVSLYHPLPNKQKRWTMGYLGTYSVDRQPTIEELLVRPAATHPSRQFVVAGPMYPEVTVWPANVDRISHLPPAEHCSFYNSQQFTLNVTRAEMIA